MMIEIIIAMKLVGNVGVLIDTTIIINLDNV